MQGRKRRIIGGEGRGGGGTRSLVSFHYGIVLSFFFLRGAIYQIMPIQRAGH